MDKIQELTSKLYSEGVEKGQAEADKIIADAKAQYDTIIGNAKKEAEQIMQTAQKKCR